MAKGAVRDRTRVRVTEGNTNDGTLHFRAPMELLERFNELAERTGTNKSQLARALFEKALGDSNVSMFLSQTTIRVSGAARRLTARILADLPQIVEQYAEMERAAITKELEDVAPVEAEAGRAFDRWRRKLGGGA